jgi:photosystem II stability/assembly factor-like uncharacterized protein
MKNFDLLIRIALFGLVLSLGTITALILGETTGLALDDLSGSPVETVVETTNSDTLFATLEGQKRGIYRSDDYGRSWQIIGQGPAGTLNHLVVHPANKAILYAATGGEANDRGLWSSQDGGQNWQKNDLKLSDAEISVLEIDPTNPETLYVGTQGQGLYRVQPGYENVERIGDALMQKLYVNEVIVGPAEQQLYAVTTEGLFVINGQAWHEVENLPDAAISLAVNPANSQILYAGTVAYGVFRSEDGGRTWETFNQGLGQQSGLMLQVPAIAVDQEDPQHLALTTAYMVGDQVVGEGIYESFNEGQHWVKIAAVDEVIDSLIIQEGGIYAATAEGLTRYGNPMPAAPWSSTLRSRSLTNPTTIQVVVLILTVIVAAWLLLGRLNWLPKRNQQIV